MFKIIYTVLQNDNTTTIVEALIQASKPSEAIQIIKTTSPNAIFRVVTRTN